MDVMRCKPDVTHHTTLKISHRQWIYSQFRKKSIIISQNIIRKGTTTQQRNAFRTYIMSFHVQICAVHILVIKVTINFTGLHKE